MAKVTINQIDNNERKRIVGELLDVVCNLKNREEMFEFLFRLLTPSEVIMLARRMQIAKMILTDATYDDICKKLHVSCRTIADVEGWLRENASRVNLVAKKLKSLDNQKKKSSNSDSMLDKYARHRFIKNLFS